MFPVILNATIQVLETDIQSEGKENSKVKT